LGSLIVSFNFFFARYGVFFGSSSVQVDLATPNPDTQGVYAAIEHGKLSLVVVNKNPDTPIAFNLLGILPGSYFLRHFGGAAGVAKWQASSIIPLDFHQLIAAFTVDLDYDQVQQLYRCPGVHGSLPETKVNSSASSGVHLAIPSSIYTRDSITRKIPRVLSCHMAELS
jgi:hypothetical protein